MIFLLLFIKPKIMRQQAIMMMMGIGIMFLSQAVKAQYNKAPVQVENVPTLNNMRYNPNYDHSDQGRRMYINNSQFQNKDNTVSQYMPVSNGQYVKPGNSNPINRELYNGESIPSGTIYSGFVPVRTYGGSNTGVIQNPRP